jgi:hypothetical protein
VLLSPESGCFDVVERGVASASPSDLCLCDLDDYMG